jgi:hypothetical protein
LSIARTCDSKTDADYCSCAPLAAAIEALTCQLGLLASAVVMAADVMAAEAQADLDPTSLR